MVGVGPLVRSRQRRNERLQEGFQAWQHAPQQAGRDFGIFQQFVQADAEPSFHRASPFGKWFPPKGLYTTSTYGRSGERHSRTNKPRNNRLVLVGCLLGGSAWEMLHSHCQQLMQ